MRLGPLKHHITGGRQGAYTLVDAVVALGLAGIVFVSVFTGFSGGFAIIQITRENLRASQILTEKMEIVRLCNWTQITNGTFLPASFSVPYDSSSASNNGLIYGGTTTVATLPLTESYSNDLRLITVQLSWASGNVQRVRTASTIVSLYGLQNYIY